MSERTLSSILQVARSMTPSEAVDLAQAIAAELPEADRLSGTEAVLLLLHSAWRVGWEPPHVDQNQETISGWISELLRDVEAPSEALAARTRAVVIGLLEGRIVR